MANFDKLIITNVGKIVDAKVKADVTKTLKFTKIQLGDGELGGTGPIELENLINMKYEINIFTVKLVQESIVRIGFEISNFDEQFNWREIGIFVQDPDTQKDVLFIYGNANDTPEVIAQKGGSSALEKYINVDLVVDNANQIEVILNESLLYVSQQEFLQVKTQLENDISTLQTNVLNLQNQIPTIQENCKPQYVEGYNLQKGIWMQNYDNDNNGYKYLITAKGVTKNHRVNIYMDLINQEKLVDGYTETKQGFITIYTSEQPTEDITVNLEITLVKEGTLTS